MGFLLKEKGGSSCPFKWSCSIDDFRETLICRVGVGRSACELAQDFSGKALFELALKFDLGYWRSWFVGVEDASAMGAYLLDNEIGGKSANAQFDSHDR